MTLKTDKPTTFRLWREGLNLSRKQTAAALDLSIDQIRYLDEGKRRGKTSRPVFPDKRTRYAMAAIAKKLDPWNE